MDHPVVYTRSRYKVAYQLYFNKNEKRNLENGKKKALNASPETDLDVLCGVRNQPLWGSQTLLGISPTAASFPPSQTTRRVTRHLQGPGVPQVHPQARGPAQQVRSNPGSWLSQHTGNAPHRDAVSGVRAVAPAQHTLSPDALRPVPTSQAQAPQQEEAQAAALQGTWTPGSSAPLGAQSVLHPLTQKEGTPP